MRRVGWRVGQPARGLNAAHVGLLQTLRAQVICRRGMWPEDQSRLTPGSIQWAEARRKAIAEALSIEDAVERRAARRRVDERYGPGRLISGSESYVPCGRARASE